MTRRRRLLQGLALAALAAQAPHAPGVEVVSAAASPALPPELKPLMPQATLRGQGRLRFLLMQVYDIRLWSAQPVRPQRWADTPLALEVVYARSLAGRVIAERSLEEMRRQGPLPSADETRWLDRMSAMFPDVAEGDRITGVHRPGVGLSFFHNGAPRGEVNDAAFARRFVGIWLAESTSEPALRALLLPEVQR